METYTRELDGHAKGHIHTDIIKNLSVLVSLEISKVSISKKYIFFFHIVCLIYLYFIFDVLDCYIFGYSFFSDKQASQKMLNAAHQLIQCGKSQGVLRNNVRVFGARQVQSTLSPGYQLYTQIQDWPEWASSP